MSNKIFTLNQMVVAVLAMTCIAHVSTIGLVATGASITYLLGSAAVHVGSFLIAVGPSLWNNWKSRERT